MKARTTDGPARSAIAAAVRTNRPAPMMAPMPSAMSAMGPSVRLSVPSPVAEASLKRRSMDLVLNNEPATNPPCYWCRCCSFGLKPERLYATFGKAIEKRAHARRGVAARQQVGDHRDGRRSGGDHAGRPRQGDAPDCDDRHAARLRGGAHQVEAPGAVAGVLAEGAVDGTDGDVA